MRSFLERHRTSDNVLEIGGGRAGGYHTFGDLFPNRHTFDIDSKAKPDTLGDVHELPFGDSLYDYILCTEVLEHLHSPWIAISEMKRVLKPGGKLILTTRFIFPIHEAPHDYYRYTEYGLKHLFKDWNIRELQAETESFSAVGALMQRLGFQSKVRGGKLTKMCLYMLAWIFDHLNWLLVKEYGDIRKDVVQRNIITTGYYLSATKPSN